MAFVRIKRIKGKPYAYLVENAWRKGTAKQKVKGYLGRVHKVVPAPAPALPADLAADDIIAALIAAELAHHNQDVRIAFGRRTVHVDGKEQVLALNQGYLCTRTLRDLLKALHIRNEERPGTALAEAFTRAGLRIPPSEFIRLYRRHHP